MDNIDGVSVVIPSARIDAFSNLLTVIEALSCFTGQKELIIAADREVGSGDFLHKLADEHAFIRIQQINARRTAPMPIARLSCAAPGPCPTSGPWRGLTIIPTPAKTPPPPRL